MPAKRRSGRLAAQRCHQPGADGVAALLAGHQVDQRGRRAGGRRVPGSGHVPTLREPRGPGHVTRHAGVRRIGRGGSGGRRRARPGARHSDDGTARQAESRRSIKVSRSTPAITGQGPGRRPGQSRRPPRRRQGRRAEQSGARRTPDGGPDESSAGWPHTRRRRTAGASRATRPSPAGLRTAASPARGRGKDRDRRPEPTGCVRRFDLGQCQRNHTAPGWACMEKCSDKARARTISDPDVRVRARRMGRAERRGRDMTPPVPGQTDTRTIWPCRRRNGTPARPPQRE